MTVCEKKYVVHHFMINSKVPKIAVIVYAPRAAQILNNYFVQKKNFDRLFISGVHRVDREFG